MRDGHVFSILCRMLPPRYSPLVSAPASIDTAPGRHTPALPKCLCGTVACRHKRRLSRIKEACNSASFAPLLEAHLAPSADATAGNADHIVPVLIVAKRTHRPVRSPAIPDNSIEPIIAVALNIAEQVAWNVPEIVCGLNVHLYDPYGWKVKLKERSGAAQHRNFSAFYIDFDQIDSCDAIRRCIFINRYHRYFTRRVIGPTECRERAATVSQTLEHIQVGSALRLPKCELIQPDFAAEPIEGAVPFQRFKRGRKRFERMPLARPDELRHMSGV